MTPAINLARRAGIEHSVHEYDHDPEHPSYGLEAAEKMGVDASHVFKTLVVAIERKRLAVAIVPVDRQLNLKSMARAVGAKKVEMADASEVQRVTGYVLGGVSPLGQKKRLPTVIDTSAQSLQEMYVSAGRRGLDIQLKPSDLSSLTDATFALISQQ